MANRRAFQRISAESSTNLRQSRANALRDIGFTANIV
jgi:hypothetical protein